VKSFCAVVKCDMLEGPLLNSLVLADSVRYWYE